MNREQHLKAADKWALIALWFGVIAVVASVISITMHIIIFVTS